MVPAIHDVTTSAGWEIGALTIVRPEPPRDLKPEAFRLQNINHDAEELSALSALMQSDLSQLRKGVLSKELEHNLKKMEKLAKKLRQEVSH